MEIIIGAIVLLIAVVAGTYSVSRLGPDNPVEEVAEEIIKRETGIDIDLTPDEKGEIHIRKKTTDKVTEKVEYDIKKK